MLDSAFFIEVVFEVFFGRGGASGPSFSKPSGNLSITNAIVKADAQRDMGGSILMDGFILSYGRVDSQAWVYT